jgi:hypothetical protein
MGADSCKDQDKDTVRNASTNNAVGNPPLIEHKGLHHQDPVKQSAIMSAAAAECDAQQSVDQALLRVQENEELQATGAELRKLLTAEALAHCERQQSTIPKGEHRAVTIHQLNLLATIAKLMVMKQTLIDSNKYSKNFNEQITWINVNMYHLCTHAIKPLSAKDKCSWIELVASGMQKPTWFLSHSWGTPFNETMQMLEFFKDVHKLPDDAAFWLCTLANVNCPTRFAS